MTAEWYRHNDFHYSIIHAGTTLTAIYCGMPPRMLNYTVDQGYWSIRYRTPDMERSQRVPGMPVRGLAEAQRQAIELANTIAGRYKKV